MKKYFPKELEPKWIKKWAETQIYHAEIDSDKEKKYILDMFPYPSGDGLHVGHFKGYVASDIISRYYRHKGFNVLHPIGWDAFGLPAENYAIKKGIHPEITTAKNISNIKHQMEITGLSYDWGREINTTDPNYYKWTQWIFLKLFEKGLAYEDELPINFCPSCKTGLANEEVVGGRCERCGTEVERRIIRQWVLRITKYADRLVDGLDGLDWPEFIKLLQVNWIGKSEGTKVKFDIENRDYDIEAFTTRIDTLYGATALVLAPEHPRVEDLIVSDQRKEVEKYIQSAQSKSDLERTSLEKEKTGVFIGSYAINPLSGDRIPVWIADYVLGFYGSGAVMLVPAHDRRDSQFAQKYNLEIKGVILPLDLPLDGTMQAIQQPYEGGGRLTNSGNFSGLNTDEAKKAITEQLKKVGKGDFEIQYKLRDWLFSRQRYWGEPIPLVHCPKCGIVPVPEEDLPVKLPEVEKYEPTGTGESPLVRVTDWVNTTCPKCAGPAKRETNTMPQWAGSCWYYLRFLDPNNKKELVSKEADQYWMPVDWYLGGAEHAVLHLLYARFWHKFLFDLGVISTDEPFKKLSTVGLVLADDGRKMSKSLGNVIRPDDIIEEYGADTLRVYEAFMGPFENTIAWDSASINGAYKFLNRIWEIVGNQNSDNSDNEAEKGLNKLIIKVSKDIENTKFNTPVAALMEFVNLVYHKNLTLEQKKKFLIVLSPFAPFITEELWEMLGQKYSVHQQSWPKFEEKYLEEEEVTIAIQVNGKLRDQMVISKDIVGNREVIEKDALELPQLQKFLAEKAIKKMIYVPSKVLNIVTD